MQAETKVAMPAGLARSASNIPGEIHLCEAAKVLGPAFAGDENPAADTLFERFRGDGGGVCTPPLNGSVLDSPGCGILCSPPAGIFLKVFFSKAGLLNVPPGAARDVFDPNVASC